MSRRMCKRCALLKDRQLYAKYITNNDKIYVDLHKKRWNGRVCPDCHREQVQKDMREFRKAQKSVVKVDKDAI